MFSLYGHSSFIAYKLIEEFLITSELKAVVGDFKCKYWINI